MKNVTVGKDTHTAPLESDKTNTITQQLQNLLTIVKQLQTRIERMEANITYKQIDRVAATPPKTSTASDMKFDTGASSLDEVCKFIAISTVIIIL